MSKIDIPAHSEFAQDVLDIFLQDSIGIFFYFEDAHHESVYERLIHRLIPNIKEFRVICLGGKTKIKTKTKEAEKPGITKIFIIDKDYDDLLGEVFLHPNVYYLHAFSIENYLAELEPLLKLAVELNPRGLTLAHAKKTCHGYKTFESKLKERLEIIARHFIVARKHRVSIETTKMSVDNLLSDSNEDFIPSDEWIDSYKNKIIQSLDHKNEWLENPSSFANELANAFDKNSNSSFASLSNHDHICGKHLIGCTVRYIQNELSVNMTGMDSVEMYVRLLNHSDMDKLSFLKKKICDDHPELISA